MQTQTDLWWARRRSTSASRCSSSLASAYVRAVGLSLLSTSLLNLIHVGAWGSLQFAWLHAQQPKLACFFESAASLPSCRRHLLSSIIHQIGCLLSALHYLEMIHLVRMRKMAQKRHPHRSNHELPALVYALPVSFRVFCANLEDGTLLEQFDIIGTFLLCSHAAN